MKKPLDGKPKCSKCGRELFDNGTVYVHRYTVENITYETQDCPQFVGDSGFAIRELQTQPSPTGAREWLVKNGYDLDYAKRRELLHENNDVAVIKVPLERVLEAYAAPLRERIKQLEFAKNVVSSAASDALPWMQDGPIWKERAEALERELASLREFLKLARDRIANKYGFMTEDESLIDQIDAALSGKGDKR